MDENCLVLDRLQRFEVQALDEPAVKIERLGRYSLLYLCGLYSRNVCDTGQNGK